MLDRAPSAYEETLRQHHGILRASVRTWGGSEFQESGDGFCMAFADVRAAASAALEAQEKIAAARWPPETGCPRVRMAIHWEKAEFREGQYRGPAMHLAARLLSAAHGGQIICSATAAEALGETFPIRKLGTFQLRGFESAVAIAQINADTEFPPLRADHARRHNLPAPPECFIGREAEISSLTALLDSGTDSGRCVTLSGPGGIGKTAIAVQAAHRLLTAYDHAVTFVSLASLTRAEEIPGAILEALGMQVEPGREPLGQLADILGQVPALMIFDNFEHLAAEGRITIAHLRRRLPLAHFLLTSRIRLGFIGEQEIPVEALGIPDENEDDLDTLKRRDAVRLFALRAARARPGFQLDSANARPIARTCRLLDGIPLAIELAAARMQVLTADDLLQGLLEKVIRPENEPADGSDRLQSVFTWSIGLLPPDVRLFLGALSVFRGGWTTGAAGDIGRTGSPELTVAYLHYLLTCSLIQATEAETGMRFRMLEPIRQLAQSCVGSWNDAEKRHREYFQTMARKAGEITGTEREVELLRVLAPECANLVAALEREPSNQRRLYSAVDIHGIVLYRSQNRAVRTLLTELGSEGGPVKPETLARAWHAAGALDSAVLENTTAENAFRRAWELFQAIGDDAGAASAQFNLAALLDENGQTAEALDRSLEILNFFRTHQAFLEHATALTNLILLCRKLGRFDEARKHAAECMELCERHSLPAVEAHALGALADVAIGERNWDEASHLARRSLEIHLRLGQSEMIAPLLICFAQSSAGQCQWAQAAYFVGASRAAIERHPNPSLKPALPDLDLAEAEVRKNLDPCLVDRFEQAGQKALLSAPVAKSIDWLNDFFLQIPQIYAYYRNSADP